MYICGNCGGLFEYYEIRKSRLTIDPYSIYEEYGVCPYCKRENSRNEMTAEGRNEDSYGY